MAWWNFWRTDAPQLPAPESDPVVVQEVHRWDAASVVNSLTGLGGSNDKGAAARPNTARRPLDDVELAALYLQGGIAQKIVRIIPDEMTRKGWTVKDSTEDPEALKGEERRLMLRARVREAATWGRLFGTSLILMVTDEEIPAEYQGKETAWLRQPLELDRVNRLVALQVFDGCEVTPMAYETDPRKVGYREPVLWSITPVTAGGGQFTPGTVVHASRVLTFRGVRRPPSVRLGGLSGSLSATSTNSLDDSVLQHTWDAIRNLEQVSAAGAVLAQEIRENVLRVGGLEALVTADQKTAVETRIRLMAKMKSLLGMVMLGKDDEFTSTVHNPSGFNQLSGEAQAMLSAVSDIPQTILFGHTPAGLSTDNASGRQAFDRKIATAQEAIRPDLERIYSVILASKEGPTGGEVPESWSLEFLPLDELSQSEEAGIRKTTAETDAIYLDRGVLSPERVESSRFGPDGYQVEIQPEEEGDDRELTPEEAQAELDLILDAIDMTPPEGVIEEFRRGLRWYDEGHGGDGLVRATIQWAHRLARGEPITEAKVRKMRAWLARHEVDKEGEGFRPGEDGYPSPGRVAWALWGGDPAVSWSEKLIGQLDREE